MNKLSKCHKLLTSIGDALSPSNLDNLEPILPYVTNMLENTHHAITSAISGNSTGQPLTPFEPSLRVGPARSVKNNYNLSILQHRKAEENNKIYWSRLNQCIVHAKYGHKTSWGRNVEVWTVAICQVKARNIVASYNILSI